MDKIKLFRFLLFISTLLFFSSCAKTIAGFGFTEPEKPAPAVVSFDNQSKNAESYEWNFGDGTTSNEVEPQHEFTSSGNYVVSLKAMKGGKVSTINKQLTIEQPKVCLVEIETTLGTMKAILYDATPQHRDNFLKLAEEGFYDDLLFHRVINGFMIQGGDPQSRNADAKQRLGSGGPGYLVPAEFVDTLAHVKGALAAARTNNPKKKSSGSQFYIVQGRKLSDSQLDMMEAQKDIRYTPEQREIYTTQGGTPQLDQEYTVFGQVIEGLDVLDKIAATATAPGDRPKMDIKMKIRPIN